MAVLKIPFSSIAEPWWDSTPLAIAGTGPSLEGFDFGRLEMPDVRILAVKEAIWELPFANALFGLDRPWLNRQADRLRELKAKRPDLEMVFSVEGGYGDCAIIDGAAYVQRSRFQGFSDDPAIIQSGANSGFGAVNLAYLKRAKSIVLFGFDYLETATRHHYHAEKYPWYRSGQNARYWKNWGSNFDGCLAQMKAHGVEIINASPSSTVTAFPKVTIEEGLLCLDRLRFSRSRSVCGSAVVNQSVSDAADTSTRTCAG